MKSKTVRILAASVAVLTLGLPGCRPKPGEKDVARNAEEIHLRVLTVDTHCDTPMRMVSSGWDMSVRHEPGRRSGCIDLPRMLEGGLDAEFFAVFTGQGPLTDVGYAEARQSAAAALDAVDAMCAGHPDLVALAFSPEDAYRLEKEGRRAAFVGMENGYPVGTDLSLVRTYYDRGVRYLTLCHSSDNDICDSSTDRDDPEDRGLSDFGRQVVAECNRLGMMIDVSHSSDRSLAEILELTQAPVIASHSCARALCDHPRNLSDDMLRAVAENGGVIQICFVSGFLKKQKSNPEREKAMADLREKYGSFRDIKDEDVRRKVREEYEALYEKYPGDRAEVRDIVDHVDHVVRLIGVDHVGFGTDFDGGGGVEGCDDVSDMPRLTEELLRRGYSEEDIRKIWGGNIMRVFSEVIRTAQSLQAGGSL